VSSPPGAQRALPICVIDSQRERRISRWQKRRSTHFFSLNSRVWSANQRDAGLVESEYVRMARDSGQRSSRSATTMKLEPCGTFG
jgi:hypothetical protein